MFSTSTQSPEVLSPRTIQIALLGGPVSPNAIALVDQIMVEVVLPAQQKAPRPSSEFRLRLATGALMADLFDLKRDLSDGKPARHGAHGMSAGSFAMKELGFAYDIFKQVIDPLEAAGLVKRRPGQPRWQIAFNKVFNSGGVLTTFQATPGLLEIAGGVGVVTDDWADHWCRVRPEWNADEVKSPTLILRGQKQRINGKSQPGKDLPVNDADERVVRRKAELSALNDFLAAQEIGGLAFPGLCRIFNNGDQDHYAWDQGGRFYSRKGGHRYEHWGAAKRCEDISLNGEAVGEVDISASHLTLFHALLDKPFDPESKPYEIPGFPRHVVKLWVSQALGAGNPRPTQWSKTAQADYLAETGKSDLNGDFAVRQVGALVVDKHPALIDLKASGLSTLALQFHEAEVLRLAMEGLMLRQGIPVLPIHDALIAPQSKLEAASLAIVDAFREYVSGVIGHHPQVVPKVAYKQP